MIGNSVSEGLKIKRLAYIQDVLRVERSEMTITLKSSYQHIIKYFQ